MSAIIEQFSAVLWNVINRPSIVDLIDILLLTFLIYEMLVHLQHTRVSQTLKGIVLLLLATWLSDVIGMRTIHALLSWVINAGPVLLIVLFQQEIRRVLEELGATNLFDSAARIQQTGGVDLMIDELILALEHMSRRRVGALIVIENKTRLNDVIATGTRVDGVISQPLLENIFEPNTPLHDGAVVVRGDRIMSAACLLHLSDTTGVGRDLGTRHRAGLGMSEISDATVFIVSEETGIISMARGGELVRHLDEASLHRILHEMYDGAGKEQSRRSLSVPLRNLKQRRRGAHDEQQNAQKE
ncbi:MAG: diadenylate cyclase CdaA [Christensenellales bacterium]|nr:diadenylate cyclase CdaA [Christensenellales bacterium]